MSYDLNGLLELWTDADSTDAAFRRFYADPVWVNGTALTIADLIDQANALRAAFDRPRRTVLDGVESGRRVAVAFELTGRHVGLLRTASAVLEPTGEYTHIRVIDILTLDTDDRITGITMVAEAQGVT